MPVDPRCQVTRCERPYACMVRAVIDKVVYHRRVCEQCADEFGFEVTSPLTPRLKIYPVPVPDDDGYERRVAIRHNEIAAICEELRAEGGGVPAVDPGAPEDVRGDLALTE